MIAGEPAEATGHYKQSIILCVDTQDMSEAVFLSYFGEFVRSGLEARVRIYKISAEYKYTFSCFKFTGYMTF